MSLKYFVGRTCCEGHLLFVRVILAVWSHSLSPLASLSGVLGEKCSEVWRQCPLGPFVELECVLD